MKFKKIGEGVYQSENGYTIRKHVPTNLFTGKAMNSSETRWNIYNSKNEKIDWAFTLKEAKAEVEKM